MLGKKFITSDYEKTKNCIHISNYSSEIQYQFLLEFFESIFQKLFVMRKSFSTIFHNIFDLRPFLGFFQDFSEHERVEFFNI